MKPKKIPMRQCTGCREHKPKRELIRVVRSPEGEAYLCPSVDCLAKARKSKALERSLECQIPDEIYDRLSSEMEDNIV